MGKRIAIIVGLMLFWGAWACNANDTKQQTGEEKYEAVAIDDYEPNMELSGRIQWDKNGLANGGPVTSFSFWGHESELTNNMITNGFLSTKDYGKIMIKANPDFSMHIELTPSQQKKLKQLKKKILN
jgi:hypothetical protein